MTKLFSVTDLVDQYFEVQNTWKRHAPDAPPRKRYRALVEALGLPDDWAQKLDASRDAAWAVIYAASGRIVGADLTSFSDLPADAQWAALSQSERQAAEHTFYYLGERERLWRARQDQAGALRGPVYPLDTAVLGIMADAKAAMLAACRQMDALVFERMFGVPMDKTLTEEDIAALSGVSAYELNCYLFDAS